MATPPHTPTRWRPRFSVRTLVVIVTLVCAYFGCWHATQSHGTRDVESLLGQRVGSVGSPMPFVVTVQEHVFFDSQMHLVLRINREVDCYFWFCGYVAKLPGS